jgi:hypothetical protein
MGLLPCMDRLDLIRFCLLTLPCKLMLGTSFSFLLSICLETNAIDSETVESCRKPLRTVGSCRKTPWGQSDLVAIYQGLVGSRRKTTNGQLDFHCNIPILLLLLLL